LIAVDQQSCHLMDGNQVFPVIPISRIYLILSGYPPYTRVRYVRITSSNRSTSTGCRSDNPLSRWSPHFFWIFTQI